MDDKNEFLDRAKSLPGVNRLVRCPCYCSVDNYFTVSVFKAVLHLNDIHKWTREEIAGWLDELHDDGIIDIEF